MISTFLVPPLAVFGMSGPWEWVVVLVIVLIFFGVGKLPNVLGQMGKGVKSFKDGMKDGDAEAAKALDVTDDSEEVTEVGEVTEIKESSDA